MRMGILTIFLFLSAGCSQHDGIYGRDCNTPLGHWRNQADGLPHLRYVQPIIVDANNRIDFNGEHIDVEVLKRRMAQMSKLQPAPFVVLEVDPSAGCVEIQKIRNAMDETCQDNKYLCAEGNNWKQW